MTTTPLSTSQTPTYDSEGHQTWKPEVGIYFKPGFGKRDGYGGVVAALQDLHVSMTGQTKSYPENFAGIIAAIKDLQIAAEEGPGSETGPTPPNLEIIINPDTGIPEYDYTEEPANGDLWFDTRQGRLFVWVDDDWYQTNGADGLPIVTETANPPGVQYIVPGQLWWDKSNNDLYIFDGTYQHADGTVDTDPTDGQPVWLLASDAAASDITTNTLPLGALLGPKIATRPAGLLLPDIELENFNVQRDYNGWLYAALEALETEILKRDTGVHVSDTPPDLAEEGDLWYDNRTLELSVLYDDGSSLQWVPTSAGYEVQGLIGPMEEAIAAEAATRNAAVNNIYRVIAELEDNEDRKISALTNELGLLEHAINLVKNHNENLPGYVKTSDLNPIDLRIKALESYPGPDLSSYVTTGALDQKAAEILGVINGLPHLSSIRC